jgi:hypothetical protein
MSRGWGNSGFFGKSLASMLLIRRAQYLCMEGLAILPDICGIPDGFEVRIAPLPDLGNGKSITPPCHVGCRRRRRAWPAAPGW